MMSERLRSRDPKSNTTKSYTMFFEDENKYNSVNSSSSGSSNNNNNSDNNNLNNNLKKFLKKQLNLNNNNSGGGSSGINNNACGDGSIGDMDNDDKVNREQFFENFPTEQNLAVMENGRKRKYDKIKEEENNGSNSNNNNNNNNCSGNELLDEDNQHQQQQQLQHINENQNTNDKLNENLNETKFNKENLNENIDENDAKKTKLDNNPTSYHNIESQALINRNLQRLLHHQHDDNEEDVDNDLESAAIGGDISTQPGGAAEQKDNINNNIDTINIPTTANINNISCSANSYNNAALNNSAYLESLEIIKKIKYDDTRELMYQVYQPWVLQTYGDSAKTKTITQKKQERIIKTLTGQEVNNPDSSKFRFWVKSKGFTTEKPKEFKEIEIDRSNLSNEQRLEDKNVCLLYVPNFSKDSTAQPYRKVAVVEYFFDIIFEVHVGLGGRSGRHAGQKRTYRTISESYAFLPREAVTKFLSGCILCRKFPIRTFTTFTSKFLEEQLTDSSTEFVENSPKSELNGNNENLNNNNNINNNNDDKKLHENDNKNLNNDNNASSNNNINSNNNNNNNNNNTTSTSKDTVDGVKLSVDWEEEINLETSKSNEKKFVSNINNINSKIEHDLLNELNENFFLSASTAAAAAASVSDDKNCIKNITITNELVTYYHLLKQFYEQQHHMKVNPMSVTPSPAPSSSSSSLSTVTTTTTTATTNITTKSENEIVNLVQQQQNLRQIRLPQKNLMEDYKNLPLIMSTLSQSFKQNNLLLQVQQQSQLAAAAQSSAISNPQSLIDLTITKSPSPQPVVIKSPQLSPKSDQPINNININMKNFDNLSINVSTNIEKNKLKILCNTTPPKKRYNNFFTTTTPTALIPTISNTIASPSSSSVSSSLSSASILNDNLNFMNNLLLNNNNNNNNNNGGGGGGTSSSSSSTSSNDTATNNSNNLIFKQKNEKIENIIKKCEMKNQQHNNNNNNSGNNNNSNNNNVYQLNPITSTYLNMTRSMGLSDDDALKFDELGVKMFCDETVTTVSDVSDNHVDDPYAGVMKDADKLKLMLLAWNYQNSAAVRNGTEGPDLAAVSGLWAQYQNALAMQAAAVKPSTSPPIKLDSPIEMQDETNSSGQKDDDDLSDDDMDDRMDQTPHDPERLKAFNMFVRLFVDENLDRMVPISKQPKEKIQAIIDSCTRQFPEFAERSRKRIRTYLKSCRRNKKARDGWETSSRPTPAHLTSVQAEQILASACDNESMNAKRMRMGMEPISQAVSPSLIIPIETTVTPTSYMSSILKSTNNTDTLTMPSLSTLCKPSPSSSSSSSLISANLNLSDAKNLSATITSSASLNNNNNNNNNNLIGGGGPINSQSILSSNNNLNSNNNSNNSSSSNISTNNNKIPNNINNNNNKLIPPPNALYRNEFSKPNNMNYPSGSGSSSSGGGGGGNNNNNNNNINNNNNNNNNGQGGSIGVNMNTNNSNGRSNSSMPPPSTTPTQPTYPTFISHSATNNNASNNNNNNNNSGNTGSNSNNNTNINPNKSSTNGPTDLSMKQLKPPLLAHKLNASELDAVRQLVTGYRESAAFLLRSADELEQLLLSQQQ